MSTIEARTGLESKIINERIDRELMHRAARVEAQTGRQPGIALIVANEHHGPSVEYVGMKERIAKRLGIAVRLSFPKDVAEMYEDIQDYNSSHYVDGIVPQLPFKKKDVKHQATILGAIDPSKDVDGLGPRPEHASATAAATVRLMRDSGVNYLTQPVGIAGRGPLVGGPLEPMLKAAGAQDVKSFDIDTDPLERLDVINRPVLISATGVGGLLTPDLYVNTERRTIIDAGKAEQGGVVMGDVSDELREFGMTHDWRISPLKGGLGPLTIRMLLANVVQSAERREGLPTPFPPPHVTTYLPYPQRSAQ